MRSLFRPEALQAQQQSWLGGVQLARPLSLSLLTGGAVLALVAVLTFLSLADYTRKASTRGVLVPDLGLIRLVPAAAGTVVESRVREGQTVAAGDLLFVLALDRARWAPEAQAQVARSLEDRRRSLQAAAQQQDSLAATQRAALDRRLLTLEAELAQLDAETALQQQRLSLAQQALARLESLQGQQAISQAQVQAKGEEVLALRAAAQALARQKLTLSRERAELDGERRSQPAQAAVTAGGIERELSQLDREVAELGGDSRLLVRAPAAGVVSAVLADTGQSVAPGAALASLLPAGATLQAHLYAPSSAVGFVRAEQAVRLRFDAYPYQKYGHMPGRVLHVSRTPLAASELAALSLPASEGGSGEPMFRITVALEPARTDKGADMGAGTGTDGATTPSDLALAPGMRLQADVLLDTRRLIAWLFEPLQGWRDRN